MTNPSRMGATPGALSFRSGGFYRDSRNARIFSLARDHAALLPWPLAADMDAIRLNPHGEFNIGRSDNARVGANQPRYPTPTMLTHMYYL